MPTSTRKVYLATLAALECAEEIGAKSIAIPGMGTGVGGVPFKEAAKAMVKAIREFERKARNLKRVVLCDLGERMIEAWRESLKE
jgi:O-acetyl-ADP-ribose deacetylase (regulator of RNase III)